MEDVQVCDSQCITYFCHLMTGIQFYLQTGWLSHNALSVKQALPSGRQLKTPWERTNTSLAQNADT
jgi:hypothetical protein